MNEPQYKPITGMINVNDIQEILENNRYFQEEIERLKEEYVMLQNASDKVEEEKDKEIERLNNIIKEVRERVLNENKPLPSVREIIDILDKVGDDKE